MTGILNVLLGDNAAPAAPSGSVWGDSGTNIVLSTTTITNDTAELINNGNWTSVRGTKVYSTGKHYFEIKILSAGAGFATFGLMDNSTAAGTDMDGFDKPESCEHYTFDGSAQVAGTNMTGVDLGSAITLANNDVMGVAFDADNGFHYLAQNNVWFLSGNPASGATGTGHVCAYNNAFAPFPRFPAAALFFIGAVQLITGAGALTYAPPSGYSAWG